MSIQEAANRSEVDQPMAALIHNAGAIRAVTEAVAGTLGPKGLDCMLVDECGDALVTNDGVTILKTMDITHPAARILINAAQYQEEEVGDGTTTTAVMIGALVNEGVNQVLRGVPVIKVIEGIDSGISRALNWLGQMAQPVDDINHPVLERVASIAGRGHRELARLIVQAARLVGGEKLREPGFKLADQILALEGSESSLIQGTIITREPINRQMPRQVADTRIVILDDALEPQKVAAEALGSKAGFEQQLHNEQLLRENLQKLAQIGVQAIFTDRAISDGAEDLLTDLGIIGVARVAMHEWRRLAELTGARPLKRTSLAKPALELLKLTGQAAEIRVNERFKQIQVLGKPEQKYVTVLVGAFTKEVVGERERIAKDTAAAVQAAWNGGIVPGGGSAELAVARLLEQEPLRGMAGYGFQCVIESLKKPLAQICVNAGFNALEKVSEVIAAQLEQHSNSIGIDCEDGTVIDLAAAGVYDPFLVKYHALKSAGEVAEAILRIQTIIKMKEEREPLLEKTWDN
ncbi:chaperonin GroEL (HSP60 family) [Hydrogenispora ethanolica]|uniref:Chaperonin GroEL (HSP60 family) n=1 Tax=Hydrogenispora ethanolica TaxID=1082276 RepID=A0A4R1REF5_HYDET|nr:TCP-1/cpn60 chaperonin family protein [Hydrogenispora ethanolica]TCL64281.1 chaperonin GroEL (HSP60 family) [Hydrogenispora ethanolica]